ncbi:hypothetical protein O1611_g3198 [Lasiodiplodia mahajangana]|uniref:Uncharacterized protein n=1 Tax=Lasiodiplodia mahajangana TaxID=1108764 RepID=A0ACC2JTB9_9PEZI|nr:hypothetical protein O1611_g3198 [Lasiodiplodia mahajangana]
MQTISQLEQIPPEVLLMILGYLPRHCLLPLRLVSKFLSNHVTSLVFSYLSLDFNHLDQGAFHRNLCWTHDVKRDPASSLSSLTDGLASLPNLKNLRIRIEFPNSYGLDPDLPPLHPFKHLSGLDISSSHNLPATYWENEVRTVVKSSVELSSFSLVLDKGHKAPPPSVQTIIGEGPRTKLERLVLKNVALPPPGLHSFCTKNLKHLTISTSPGPRAPAVAWSCIWSALRDIGVELLSLSVPVYGEEVDSMFNYLLSYSGLRELEITKVQMETELPEDAAGEVFWNAVVPRHKDSLIDLVVSPVYEGSWCYDQPAANAIRQCTSLKRLCLRLSLTGDSWFNDEMMRMKENNDVKFSEQDQGVWESSRCYLALLILKYGSEATLLEKLVVDIANPASRREMDMGHLRRGTRPKGSRDLYELRSQMRQNLSELETALCSLQLPYDAGQGWPVIELGNGVVLRWREHVAREDPCNTLATSKYGCYEVVSA